MEIKIILDDFQVTFSDLVDKEKYNVIATEDKNKWVVEKKPKPQDTKLTN